MRLQLHLLRILLRHGLRSDVQHFALVPCADQQSTPLLMRAIAALVLEHPEHSLTAGDMVGGFGYGEDNPDNGGSPLWEWLRGTYSRPPLQSKLEDAISRQAADPTRWGHFLMPTTGSKQRHPVTHLMTEVSKYSKLATKVEKEFDFELPVWLDNCKHRLRVLRVRERREIRVANDQTLWVPEDWAFTLVEVRNACEARCHPHWPTCPVNATTRRFLLTRTVSAVDGWRGPTCARGGRMRVQLTRVGARRSSSPWSRRLEPPTTRATP